MKDKVTIYSTTGEVNVNARVLVDGKSIVQLLKPVLNHRLIGLEIDTDDMLNIKYESDFSDIHVGKDDESTKLTKRIKELEEVIEKVGHLAEIENWQKRFPKVYNTMVKKGMT